jgi:hypothetical protein
MIATGSGLITTCPSEPCVLPCPTLAVHQSRPSPTNAGESARRDPTALQIADVSFVVVSLVEALIPDLRDVAPLSGQLRRPHTTKLMATNGSAPRRRWLLDSRGDGEKPSVTVASQQSPLRRRRCR